MVSETTKYNVHIVDAPAPPFYLIDLKSPHSIYNDRGKGGYLFVTGDKSEIRCSWYNKSGGYITLELGHRDAENRYTKECVLDVYAQGYIQYDNKNDKYFNLNLPESEDKRLYPLLDGSSFSEAKGVLGLVEARLEQLTQTPDPYRSYISMLNAPDNPRTLHPESAQWKYLHGLVQKAFEEIKDAISAELSRYEVAFKEIRKEKEKKIEEDWKRGILNLSDWSYGYLKTLRKHLPVPDEISKPLTECVFDNIPLVWNGEPDSSVKRAECTACDTEYFFNSDRHSSERLTIDAPWVYGKFSYSDENPGHASGLIFSQSVMDKDSVSYDKYLSKHLRTE